MHRWYLPTLSEIILSEEPYGLGQGKSEQGNCYWYGSIAAIKALLEQLAEGDTTIQANSLLPQEGVILSGPLPVIHDPQLMHRFSNWTFMGNWTTSLRRQLPAAISSEGCELSSSVSLLAGDPLATEPFYLVLTAEFSLVASLGGELIKTPDASSSPSGDAASGDRKQLFNFSFDPEVVSQCWQVLRTRVKLTNPQVLAQLDPLVQQFAPRAPEYQLVANFSRRLLAAMESPAVTPRLVEQVGRPRQSLAQTKSNLNAIASPDVTYHRVKVDEAPLDSASALDGSHLPDRADSDAELLKAIAHEVRTPLSTIRTFTRLLLRRQDLPAQVIKRLNMIDRECTRQIERFGLIFKAVELETSTSQPVSPLAKISLEELFLRNLDRWKQQASEHDLTLDVGWANALPTVLSDPAMLDQMLTGLIDRIVHALPAGSHIQMRVIPAGDQLKLQLYSRNASTTPTSSSEGSWSGNPLSSLFSPSLSLKSIGQLLMFQPETGNLSLNLDITKNLFQALGGKFTIRRHPHEGEVVTIFLPLEQAEAS
ncbi:MAG: sensor histidine kinase [Elainellaceae cyanobacterium]